MKAGAKLNEADKTKLKKLNEEESVLSTKFNNQLLAAAKAEHAARLLATPFVSPLPAGLAPPFTMAE